MLMRFKFPWNVAQKIKDEDNFWQEVKSLLLLSEEDRGRVSYAEFEGDIEKVVDLIGPVEVIGKVTPFLLSQFADLACRIKNVEATQQKIMEISFNQKVGVHVPGLGLLKVKKTKILDDACTEVLDEHLQKGWRIVAVCPQPDQRRPDYVLGHYRRDA